jgi:hypothetical protein
MNQAEARRTLLGANAQVIQAGTRQVQLALASEFVQQVAGLPQPNSRVGKLFPDDSHGVRSLTQCQTVRVDGHTVNVMDGSSGWSRL